MQLNQYKIIELLNKSEDIYQKKGTKKALEFTKKALIKFPKNPDLLGNAALYAVALNRNSLAEDFFKKAIKHNKSNPNIYVNYGNFLKKRGELNKAEFSYKKALDMDLNSSIILSNLGNLYYEMLRYKDAKECYKKSLNLNPYSSITLFNLGILLSEAFKDFTNAVDCYKSVLKIDKSHNSAKFNLSTLLLRIKKFKCGWNYYDARFVINNNESVVFKTTQNEWNGEDITGKTLFIWPEQGVADEVMFASVLPELKDSNAQIILACDPRLVKIFAKSFPFINVVKRDEKHEYKALQSTFDYHIPIGSLPKLYRNNLSDFYHYKPYLKTENLLRQKWKSRFKNLRYQFNIGISWFGGSNKQIQRSLSIPLNELLPIFKIPANFVNLQYGNHDNEIKALANKNNICLHDWSDADPLKDLDNFAAQISELDLIISVSNATVHFAGALGVKTFLLIPYYSSWAWSEDSNDSYWYPGYVCLFRQTKKREWKEVIDTVAKDVLNMIKKY